MTEKTTSCTVNNGAFTADCGLVNIVEATGSTLYEDLTISFGNNVGPLAEAIFTFINQLPDLLRFAWFS